jgi:thiol-disulfide isomerase/thioredoxin
MTNRPHRRSATALLVAALWLCGCERTAPVEVSPSLPTGYWQANITLPGGNIETGIEISLDGDRYSASLVNGQERVRIDEVAFVGDELLLRFPAFNNEIRASLGDGRLVGELTLVKRFGETQVMPFSATPGGEAPGEQNAQANHDLSGRWAVRFHAPDGSDSASIGEFAQRGARLFGTFLNPNGDHRFLAGHVRGDDFHLSTFDGAHAFIFSGSVDADGRIVNADFWSGTSWHQQWSAERNQSVQLPDAFSRTWLKPGYERFEFAFPSEAGATVSIDDEKFIDKVIMVTLAGTWCPNCNDEARYLAPFYQQYRDQGLEIVALMFEHFDDAALAAEQVRLFREKHDIEYDTLIAGISDKAEAEKVLPSLSSVLAFPTTIFIDRDGRVRQIHTGFSGPGTGEHYIRLQRQFDDLVTELLAEPPDLIESLTGAGTDENN